MTEIVLGTCSLCGGRVSMPDAWSTIAAPQPRCQSCFAVPEQAWGPIIRMRPEMLPNTVSTAEPPDIAALVKAYDEGHK